MSTGTRVAALSRLETLMKLTVVAVLLAVFAIGCSSAPTSDQTAKDQRKATSAQSSGSY